ncbi:DeoR/GlpR family DNA-binding transcription regulator [Diplocloster hominis]|uniref:DeoR/GlpR family DNA-binding transcription regulator n=1 Tax=Diplocloster hominis TaxID=3079010 RepID=UPI0031B9CE14
MSKDKRLCERRNKILEALSSRHTLLVSDLVAELEVSNETIRKDLIEMENQGMVERKHGRVNLLINYVDDLMYVRTTTNQSAKERIAAETIKHLPEGNSVFVGLDVGNTVWHVAKLLVSDPTKIVVTSSLDAANIYAEAGNPRLYCTGGQLREVDRGFYGYWSLQNLKSIHMSVCVLGSVGIVNRDGIGAVSFDDRDAKLLYAKNSDMRIAIFDSTKCARGTLVEGLPWEAIDLVISDTGMPEADRERIEAKTRLVLV